jgi:hypothetical protein
LDMEYGMLVESFPFWRFGMPPCIRSDCESMLTPNNR